MRIAAAQTRPVPGDIAANVRAHCRFIRAAQAAAVDLLVFPELSLSGYELPLLSGCQLTPEAACLAPLREMAQAAGMTLIVGAPLTSGGDLPYIGAISLHADGSSSHYLKQYLHPGEERYVVAAPPVSQVHHLQNVPYALAICADSAQPQHAASAAAGGAKLYLASVLVSEQGYDKDARQLQDYARRLQMGVLMANYTGPSGGYRCAGQSAFWAPGGERVVAASGHAEQLVIADAGAGHWRGEVLALD